MTKPDGAFLTQDDVYASSFVETTTFYTDNCCIHFLFLAESFFLEFAVFESPYLFVTTKERRPLHFTLHLLPGLDPITQLPKPVFPSHSYGEIHFQVRDIGLMSESISPQEYIYIADIGLSEEVGIGISQAFEGNFLTYSVHCEEPSQCGEGAVITMPPVNRIEPIDLENEMRATDTRLVFQFKHWIVLVDSLSICTGILSSSD